MPKNRLSGLKSLTEKVQRGESVKAFQSRRKAKDGNTMDVWMTVTALADESGRPVEIAATERDLAWLAEQ